MAINLLSDAEDASVDSQKCKAALIYVLLNGTPPFPNKIEIEEVRDFLNSEGIPVDICEVAKAKELNLEHRLPRCLQPDLSLAWFALRSCPDEELVLKIAEDQEGDGSDSHDNSVVHEFNERTSKEERYYRVLYDVITHLNPSHRFEFTIKNENIRSWANFHKLGSDKEMDFTRSWVSTWSLLSGGPDCHRRGNDDTYRTIQILSSGMKEVMRHDIETSLYRGKKVLYRGLPRVVIDVVSEPVLPTTNLSDVFIIKSEVSKVLYYMCDSGFMHRDINVGNLLKDRGLPRYIEYAELEFSDLSHELRTGSLDFMAVEVIRHKYLFEPRDTIDTVKKLEFKAQQAVMARLTGMKTVTTLERLGNDKPPFFHNVLHDMESLWWISVRELFFYRDNTQPEMDEKRVAAWQSTSYKLFPRYLTTEYRREFLRSPETFRKMLAWLDNSLAGVRVQLNFLRSFLHNRYQMFERTFPEYDFHAFQGVQSTFQKYFNNCTICASRIELALLKTTGVRGAKTDTGEEDLPRQDPSTSPAEPEISTTPPSSGLNMTIPNDLISSPQEAMLFHTSASADYK